MKETLERRGLFYKFYLYYDLYIRHKSFIKKNPQLVCIEMLNISPEDRNKNKKTLDYLNTNGYNFIKELGPNGIFKLI